MELLKALWHGMFINYHLNKLDKIPKGKGLAYARAHHYERCNYHFEMAYGKSVGGDKDEKKAV